MQVIATFYSNQNVEFYCQDIRSGGNQDVACVSFKHYRFEQGQLKESSPYAKPDITISIEILSGYRLFSRQDITALHDFLKEKFLYEEQDSSGQIVYEYLIS